MPLYLLDMFIHLFQSWTLYIPNIRIREVCLVEIFKLETYTPSQIILAFLHGVKIAKILTKNPTHPIVNSAKSSLRTSFRSSGDLRWESVSQMKERNCCQLDRA